MRILSWNVNSILTLLQYHPWSEHRSYEHLLNTLDADIICFQEHKLNKEKFTQDVALVNGWHSFFTLCQRKSGYSGVVTYCRCSVTPFAAELGLSGLSEQAIEPASLQPLHADFSKEELLEFDEEGRVVITDHQAFILLNCYFPNAGDTEERADFQLRFMRAIEARIRGLIACGREVVLVGDVNSVSQPLDHCSPKDYENFWDYPARRWLNSLLIGAPVKPNPEAAKPEDEFLFAETGILYDTFRLLNPDRARAFTVWNSKTFARQTNSGTRIDYVLVTAKLKAALTAADIHPTTMGSDHCPVSASFDLQLPCNTKPPSGCSMYLEKFKRKQSRLVFGPRSVPATPNSIPSSELPSLSSQPLDAIQPVDSAPSINPDAAPIPSPAVDSPILRPAPAASATTKTKPTKSGAMMNFLQKKAPPELKPSSKAASKPLPIRVQSSPAVPAPKAAPAKAAGPLAAMFQRQQARKQAETE